MATNIVEANARYAPADEALPLQRNGLAPERAPQAAAGGIEGSGAPDFALRPLGDKIAYAFAGGLVVAMRELESHIAGQTQKVSDSVHQHLTVLEARFKEALAEQKALNAAVQDKFRELEAATTALGEAGEKQRGELESLRADAAAFGQAVTQKFDSAAESLRAVDERQTASVEAAVAQSRQEACAIQGRITALETALHEADGGNAADITALRTEVKSMFAATSERLEEIGKDLALHQEDLASMKSTVTAFSTAMDGLAERMDRQAESLRSMFAAYSQRETQLEQLVDGLTRLRPYPPPTPPQF